MRSSAIFPHQDANPPHVRAYLQHALQVKHDVPEDEAEQLAGRWRYGRGRDLSTVRANAFTELFGPDVGRCLYRTVVDDEWKLWLSSFPGNTYHYIRGAGFALLLSPILERFLFASVDDTFFHGVAALTLNAALYATYAANAPPRFNETMVAFAGTFGMVASFGWLFWYLTTSEDKNLRSCRQAEGLIQVCE